MTASLAHRTGRRAAQDEPHINLIWSHRNRAGDARSVKLGVVPCKLIYGLNTAMFESRQELPDLTMGEDA